jgi:hypothetical protein
MPGRVLKRKDTTVATGRVKRSMPPAQNLAGSDPDLLRNTVFNALKALPPGERSRLRDKILSDLEAAGVNIISGLVKLGIPARTSDDLSAYDMAKLVRYVRMNRPEAMRVVSAILGELITAGEQAAEGAKSFKRAA